MSAPVIWIILPGSVSILLFLLQKWERGVLISGALVAAALSCFAWFVPIGDILELGPWLFEVSQSLSVLGRKFVINANDRSILVLIYMSAAFWFIGSYVVRQNPLFVPTGLGIAALLTAAISVEPFLYAALLIEIAVLISIPMLISPAQKVKGGILRFLTLQTMGMPFILLTGWMLAGVEVAPGDTDLVMHSNFLMALGFSLMLGIFPFHIWIPMLSEQENPYKVSFLLFLFPIVISLFGISFLERYAWLPASPLLYSALRLTAMIMLVVGGIWAAFQNHLGRMMGFAVIVEIGLTLLSIGTGSEVAGYSEGLGLFFLLLLPRGLSLVLWGMALAILRSYTRGLNFTEVIGIAKRFPIAVGSLLMAHFSLAGFPLLAGFSVRLTLWKTAAGKFPIMALAAFIGSAGLLVAGLRTFGVVVLGEGESWSITENMGQSVLLVCGCILLVLVGLFPQWMYELLDLSNTVIFISP